MKKLIIAITVLLSSALLPLGPGQSDASAAFSSKSVNTIVNTGKKYIGTPYKWGGTTPKGFDCSGFVNYTIKKATGKTVPRTSTALYKKGTKISKSKLKKGDLLFFNTSGRGVSHVAIYMGNNKMIHAVSKGVKVDNLSNSYWNKRYVGAKRY
ncbi:C40 family peptidase [Pradoshia sp.]